MIHQVTVEIGGKILTLQSGLLAKQANGSVLAQYGESTVLSTVCCSSTTNPDLDFVPLSVEYNEKYYAAGKIPGGFLKREARPKDKEILVSRLIDRPMRPLFSKKFMREIQLVPTVFSTDHVNPPDIVAMCAASASTMISDIPFDGPVGAIRIVNHNNTLIINPSFTEIEESNMEIVIAGTEEGITMVEGGSKEVSEELLLEAIELARPNIAKICQAQKELAALCGKEKLPLVEIPEFELTKKIIDFAKKNMETACFVLGKEKRALAIQEVKQNTLEHFKEEIAEDTKKASMVLEDLEQEIVRNNIIKNKVRTDGRAPSDIRNITCQTGLIPRTHGCALFTRGETQALAFITLGTTSDEQIHDDIDGDRRDRFLLHYNFPPYSVGETGRLGTGRREIGHGNLAYKALLPLIPDKNNFPYTMRIVSEVLESNGSSSMATVCAGSMAMMDAGVQIPKSIAGIAMGLIKEGNDTVVLSDILGEEDHLGDMDFKIAGTRDGITAFQMDIKIKNIDADTMKIALTQAKEGRMKILDTMEKTIKHAKDDLSLHAPRILSIEINPEHIGMIIGSGGKTIRSLTEKYGVEINIEETGHVSIFGKDAKASSDAKIHILSMLEEPEIGKEYDGIVKRITEFGAFIEILPGKEGLCHISKIAKQRIKTVDSVLKLNDRVNVKIIEIDRLGRINLAFTNPIDVETEK